MASGAQTGEAMGIERTLPSVQLLLREPVPTASFLSGNLTVLHCSQDGSLAARHPSLGVRWGQINHRIYYRPPAVVGLIDAATRSMHVKPSLRIHAVVSIRYSTKQFNPHGRAAERSSSIDYSDY